MQLKYQGVDVTMKYEYILVLDYEHATLSKSRVVVCKGCSN